MAAINSKNQESKHERDSTPMGSANVLAAVRRLSPTATHVYPLAGMMRVANSCSRKPPSLKRTNVGSWKPPSLKRANVRSRMHRSRREPTWVAVGASLRIPRNATKTLEGLNVNDAVSHPTIPRFKLRDLHWPVFRAVYPSFFEVWGWTAWRFASSGRRT